MGYNLHDQGCLEKLVEGKTEKLCRQKNTRMHRSVKDSGSDGYAELS